MSRRYRRSVRVAAMLVALALTSTATAQNCQNLRDAGDVLTFALPVSAIGLTALKRDGEGGWQLAQTMVFTGAVAGTFKQIGDKTRPDAFTSKQSFVSGHSAGAFMGASYMYTRYGKGWGIPAYGLAILTAYSRTCAQKHFADDVLGGALVAMMANWYATSPIESSGRIYPSFNSNGIELSFSGFFDGNRQPRDPANFKPRYQMAFEFGPVVQEKNIVRAPNVGGTEINLADLEAEFHMTARMHFKRFFDEKHEFAVWYGPMGMTDFGEPTEPFRVGDTVFDPSDPDAFVFDSNYRWFDLRGTYRYNFLRNDRWTLRAGLSLQYSNTKFEVEQRNDQATIVKRGEASEDAIYPLLHFSADLNLSERWSISGEIDGLGLGDQEYVNSGLFLRFHPSPLWDLSVGGRLIYGTLDEASLFNEVEITDVAFQVTRNF